MYLLNNKRLEWVKGSDRKVNSWRWKFLQLDCCRLKSAAPKSDGSLLGQFDTSSLRTRQSEAVSLYQNLQLLKVAHYCVYSAVFQLLYFSSRLIGCGFIIKRDCTPGSTFYNLLLQPYLHYKVRHPRCVFIINNIGVYLLSNTTVWWIYIYIYIIYYIENNYMFRRLIMAIYRLYMKHLISSYTKDICIWVTYMG